MPHSQYQAVLREHFAEEKRTALSLPQRRMKSEWSTIAARDQKHRYWASRISAGVDRTEINKFEKCQYKCNQYFEIYYKDLTISFLAIRTMQCV